MKYVRLPLEFLQKNWFQISVLIILIYAVGHFSSLLEGIHNEVSNVADGVEVEIVENVNGSRVPYGLPDLP